MLFLFACYTLTDWPVLNTEGLHFQGNRRALGGLALVASRQAQDVQAGEKVPGASEGQGGLVTQLLGISLATS